MKVGFVSSEIFPFSKTGGLADVSSALPHALLKDGVDICSYTPMYKKYAKKYVTNVDTFSITLGSQEYEIAVYLNKDGGFSTYLFENHKLFERDRIYESFGDNHIRFALFCKAVVYFAKSQNIDILHLNDWQSSLCAYYVKKAKLHIKTILTIHNVSYQGVFPKEIMSDIDIHRDDYRIDGFEFYRHINLLKGGIYYADYLTTVSKTYANELMNPDVAFGLHGVFKENSYKLEGISNKIDTEVWDPMNDKYLSQNYSHSSYSKKKNNKKAVLKELGLKGDKAPLFVMITRLVPQKGIEFIKYVAPYISELELNLVILGDGSRVEVESLKSLFENSENIKFISGYNEEMSHKLYGAADFLVMASLSEPCGLNQLIAYRYGALPLVRETGGLKDSVTDYFVAKKGHGAGVVFKDKDTLSFYHALFRCVCLYAESTKYTKIVKENMKMDLSWGESSRQYKNIYNKLRG